MDISVYKIQNIKTGKFYIGYSSQTEKRFRSHINMLRRGDHHCVHLQRSWNIDGEVSFEFIKIKTFTLIDDAIAEEQNQFDMHFKSKMMYNSIGTNDPSIYIKQAQSKEAILKSTCTRKQSKKFQEAIAKNRLLAFTPESQEKRIATARRNGTLGQGTCRPVIARGEYDRSFQVFKSIAEASKVLRISRGNIHSCCVGKRHRANGFLFSYQLPLV